jgi:RHS repeat-associated protein
MKTAISSRPIPTTQKNKPTDILSWIFKKLPMKLTKIIALSIALSCLSGMLAAQSVMLLYGSPCVGSNMVFQLNGPSCSSFSWSIQGASQGVHYQVIGSSSQASYQITWIAPVNNVYAYCSYFCASGSGGAYSSSYNVTGSITPAVSMSLNTTSLCQGSTITFSATPTNGGTPGYFWYVDGVQVASGSSSTYAYPTTSLAAGSHTAYVIMSSNAPCITASSATSATHNFTVNAKATYTATVNGPSQVCSGTPTGTFYITASGALGNLSYQWYKNGSPISGATSNPLLNEPIAAGNTIYCMVSSDHSCIVSPVQSNTYTVVVTPSTTPTVGIYVPKLDYCTGETITFTSSQTASSYSWTLNGSQFSTANQSTLPVSTDTNAPNTFSPGDVVRLDVTGLSGTCLTTTSAFATTSGIPIVINPVVTPTVNLSAISDRCLPGGVTLTANATHTGPSPTYTFFLDNGQVASGSSNTFATGNLTAGAHTAYVVLSSNATCASTTTVTSLTINFNAVTKTTYTATVNGPSQVCSGSPTGTFYITASGALGNLSYQWYKNGSPIAGATSNPLINEPLAAGNTIYCMVSSDYWCINTPVQSNTYTVVVTPSTTPTVGIYIPKLDYCSGETITFTSSQTASSYSWTLNGSQFSTANQSTLPVSTDTNAPTTFSPGDVVRLDVSGLSGTCLITTSAFATTSGTPIVIYPVVTPTVNLSSVADKCLPGGVTLTANATNTGPSPTYTFFLDNGQVASGSSSTFATGNLTAGAHTAYVVLSSNATCASTTSVTSLTINFNGVNKTTYTATVNGPSQVCSGTTTGTFYITASGALGNLSYQWYKNGSPIAGATSNPMINQPIVAGNTIYCMVTSDYWCIVSPVQSNTYTVVVTPSTTPTVGIQVTKLNFCVGETISFTATGVQIIGTSTYAWTLNGAAVSVPNTSSSISLPTSASPAAGYFSQGSNLQLTVSGLSGTCLTTTTASVGNPPLTITTLPIAPVTSTLLVRYNLPATLTASGAISGETYKWYAANDVFLGQGITYTTTNNLTQDATYKVSKFSTCEGPRVAFSVVVNRLPVTDAGFDQSISIHNSFTLWGNAIDPDGTVVTFAWTKTSGGAITMTPNYNTLTLTNLVAGTYVFRLTATDNFGDSSFDEMTLTVSNVLNNYNYVREEVVNIPLQTTNAQVATLDIPNKNTAISYSDGVGKDWQGISLKSSPTAMDMLQVTQYDELNRPKKSFLPIQINQATGAFKPGVLSNDVNDPNSQVKYTNSLHQQFYQNTTDAIADDTAPYADATYELSPLGRVLRQGSVGATYQPDQHYSTMSYGTNVASDFRIYTISANLPVSSATYAANLLTVTKSTDVQGVESQVVTNMEGLKLVTRTKVDATNWAETYYVYDTRNRLRFMLPPELMRLMKVAAIYNPTLLQIKTWAYQYIYDDLGRAIETRGPGIDALDRDMWTYSVYDNRDRVVLTQDAKQRLANEWSYTKYDDLDRPLISGIYRPGSAITRAAMQLTVDGLSSGLGYQNLVPQTISGLKTAIDFVITAYEGINEYKAVNSISLKPGFSFIAGPASPSFRASIDDGAVNPTSADVFPNANDEALVISYYDTYKNCVVCQDANYQFATETWTKTTNEPFQKFDRVKGKAVAGSVKILGSTRWLHTVSYFNKNSQMIQTVSSDHLNGRERSSSLVDFSGKTLEALNTYIGLPTVATIRRWFDYDHTGRVLKAYHKINSQPEVVLANNTFNELGQLVDKQIHSTGGSPYLQSVDYRHTIQGRLARMNSTTSIDAGDPNDYFGFEVAYDNAITAGGGSLNSPRFDGAITGLKWRTALPTATLQVKEIGYGYGYNNLGWLTASSYKENTFNDPLSTWNGGVQRYDENGLTYDYNGNIQALDRYTKSFITGSYVADKVDQLGYNYGAGGNQLMKIADNATSGNKLLGFKDGANTDNDYAYDINGNLTQDKNKGIISITYNFQNLVDRVTFSNNSYLQYTYDAGGSKLSQAYYNNTNQLKFKTDYVGELILQSDTTTQTPLPRLLYVLHEEGRLIMPDNANLVANPTREGGSLEGYSPNPNSTGVTLTNDYLIGETYIKAVCNQATSTPGVWPIGGAAGVYTVKPGESYSFTVLGYQSVGTSAKLFVRGGTATNIVWTSAPALPQGAANENLTSATFTIPAGITQISIGVLWATPVIGHTVYINRVALYKADLEYQYFLADQVGSPRVVLGTAPSVLTFAATMETENHSKENNQFLNLNSSKFSINTLANQTPGGNEAIAMNNAYRVGPAKSIKVFPGDIIDASAYSYWTTSSGLTQTPFATMAAALVAVMTGATTPIIDGINAAYANTNSGLPGFLLEPSQGATKPSAFINYILFDENYKPIEAKSKPVGATANAKALIALDPIPVKETGHLFVYLSYDNESTQLVYWDDLTIKVTESPVVQVNNYYPYGLVATEWVREGETDNNFLFQGKELIDKTGWQDFGARMYDGPTGRWFSNDPARQFASGYVGMGNNPVMTVDPDGRIVWFIPVIIGAVAGAYSGGVLANSGQMNPGKWDYSSGKTWGYMGAGALVGAISGGMGGQIAASGMPFANTAAIAGGSLINSVGTNIYTGGQTDMSIGFGAASYNISQDEWGYLGKKGNSALDNIGYGLGALANIQDAFAGIEGGIAYVKARKDIAGHSWIEGDKINISVGPGVDNKPNLDGVKWESQYLFKTVKGRNFITRYDPKKTFNTTLNNVNVTKLQRMTSFLDRGLSLSGKHSLNYGVWNGCVNQTSRALFMSGVFNVNAFLPITSPVLLNAELALRNYGMMFSYHMTSYR